MKHWLQYSQMNILLIFILSSCYPNYKRMNYKMYSESGKLIEKSNSSYFFKSGGAMFYNARFPNRYRTIQYHYDPCGKLVTKIIRVGKFENDSFKTTGYQIVRCDTFKK